MSNKKEKILNLLEEKYCIEGEESFNEYMKDYDTYFDKEMIMEIVRIVSDDTLSYTLISTDHDSWNEIRNYSPTIGKVIVIDYDFYFNKMTLEEIMGRVEGWKEQSERLEARFKIDDINKAMMKAEERDLFKDIVCPVCNHTNDIDWKEQKIDHSGVWYVCQNCENRDVIGWDIIRSSD